MARGPLLSAQMPEVQSPHRCMAWSAKRRGPCDRVTAGEDRYCAQHLRLPETREDKVLFYGLLARPVRTELIRKMYSSNEVVALTAIKLLLDGVEKYAGEEDCQPDELTVLSTEQLLARAREVTARLEGELHAEQHALPALAGPVPADPQPGQQDPGSPQQPGQPGQQVPGNA